MAKLKRSRLRSQAASVQPRSHSEDSSSDGSIPNTTVPPRRAPSTITLREKRRPEAHPEGAPPKRARRLDAKFARARASSDAADDGGEDIAVNPVVLASLNDHLFVTPRPARRRRRDIAVVIPQSSSIANQPTNGDRLLTARQVTLDPIEESPQLHDRDVVLDSVERDEPDEEFEAEEVGAEQAQLVRAGAADEVYNMLENEDEDEDEEMREFINRAIKNAVPRTINGLSRQRERRAPVIGDEDFGYGQLAQPRMLGPGRVTLSPSVVMDVRPIYTAAVNTRRLRGIVGLMGRPGWTARGKDWKNGFSQDEPGITAVGRRIFKYLHSFRNLVRQAPKLVGAEKQDLARQKEWLDANREKVKKSLSEIAKLVTKMRDELDVPDPDGLGANLERRAAIVGDLMNPVIPQLVRVLESLFCLGGVDPDNLNDILDEVLITPELLGYIQAVTKWISSLRVKLKWELEQRPLDNSHVRGTQLERLVKGQKSAWNLFDGAMHKLKQDLEDAEQQHEEAMQEQNEEERLAECQQRDEQIRAAREREEEEEEVWKERQYEAVARSTQWIKSQPRPMAEKWRKANERYYQEQNDQVQQPARPLVPVMSGARRPPPQFHGPPVAPNLSEQDMENKRWILEQITKEDGEGRTAPPTRDSMEAWAEAMGMEVAEVIGEVAAFQRSARELARQRRVEVPEWAREDVAVGRR
ncbi:hypothetical protein QBC34DRAFT_178429 [Podospora aff. communis PSN243]|uniref:Uncharacterized protein n=1 Tax=Podospora aff. communis PSN243 TaxID=3040156 RepID=A0AAV9H2H5_9PEZI|nr:hypothetical protein QBC34DRAFT_178429 [Podospora aff. communis PSN243]